VGQIIKQAEPPYLRTPGIREDMCRPDHLEVTFPLNGVGTCYRTQGKYQPARPLYQRVLAPRIRRQGAYHPATAQTLHDLAICVREQGQITEAASYFTQALAIRAQVLGTSMPKPSPHRSRMRRSLREKVGACGAMSAVVDVSCPVV
jgi:tetratricopeptide (TPR) repeat protein